MINTPLSRDRGQVETEVAQLTRRHAVLQLELDHTPRPGNPPLRRPRVEILAELRLCKQALSRWFIWLHQADSYEQRHAPPPVRRWLSPEARACLRDSGREEIYWMNQHSGRAA